MKRIYLVSILLSLLLRAALAQSQNADNISSDGEDATIGQTYLLESEKLSGSWKIQVSLPPSYGQTTDARYPVVYALHGNFYFKFAVGGFQRLMEFGDIPEVIIVGISNESNGYFAFGRKQADQFLNVLESDVFPFVEEQFKTHKDRTVMGWHYTSGFIFHTLVKRPDLFKNYIPVSPYLQGYKVDEIDFKSLEQMSQDKPGLRRQLYFGALNNERSVTLAALSIDSLLQKKAPKNLNWEFNLLKPDYDQSMEISVYRLWRTGLKTIYASYKSEELAYKNLEEFSQQGGLGAMKSHYVQRALRYGGVSKPPGLISLIRLAERADDFILFQELMLAFGSDFRNVNLNRVMGFAAFYRKHGKTGEGIGIYNHINAFYPNSVSVHSALAEAYVEGGQKQKAIEVYTKAIELASIQEDGRLKALQNKLAALK